MSKQIIEDFYTSFQKLDASGMLACYHPEIVFKDPAFGQLKLDRARNMWKMLCDSQRGKDFRLEFKDVSFINEGGKAHWEAWYTFSKTGRKVHNVIDAHFLFKDGLIIEHTDTFDLHRWARQAIGLQGLIFGWTDFFKKKLNTQTNRLLDKFELDLAVTDKA